MGKTKRAGYATHHSQTHARFDTQRAPCVGLVADAPWWESPTPFVVAPREDRKCATPALKGPDDVVVAGLVPVGVAGIPATPPSATARRTCHNDARRVAHAYRRLHKGTELQLTWDSTNSALFANLLCPNISNGPYFIQVTVPVLPVARCQKHLLCLWEEMPRLHGSRQEGGNDKKRDYTKKQTVMRQHAHYGTPFPEESFTTPKFQCRDP